MFFHYKYSILFRLISHDTIEFRGPFSGKLSHTLSLFWVSGTSWLKHQWSSNCALRGASIFSLQDAQNHGKPQTNPRVIAMESKRNSQIPGIPTLLQLGRLGWEEATMLWGPRHAASRHKLLRCHSTSCSSAAELLWLLNWLEIQPLIEKKCRSHPKRGLENIGKWLRTIQNIQNHPGILWTTAIQKRICCQSSAIPRPSNLLMSGQQTTVSMFAQPCPVK
jgi:hypothetical protein